MTIQQRIWYVIALCAWTAGGYLLANLIVVLVLSILTALDIPVFAGFSDPFVSAILSAVVYLLAITIVIGVPWWVKRRATTAKDIGLDRLPTWLELVIAPVGYFVYILLSMVLMLFAASLIPGFDVSQAQDVGFDAVTNRFELFLAFLTLVVLAPVAEEVLFRGYLYGTLKKYARTWIAMLVVSVVFAALHMQWNIAVGTFALSIVLCSLRELTGSLWPAIILHMISNGIAYYLLFINPIIT